MKIFSLGFVVASLAVVLTSRESTAQHLHPHGDHFDVHQNVPHGHDHAGHMTDSFGHHIDGHGRHTGAIGVYDNGATSYHPPHASHYPSYYPNNSWSSNHYGSGLYGYGYGTGYSGLGYSGLGYSGLGYSGLGLSVYVPPVVRSRVIVPGNNYSTLGSSIPTILGSSQVLTSPLANSVASRAAIPGVVANKIPVPGAGPGALASPSSGGKIVLRNPRNSGGSIHYRLNEFAYEIKPGESQTIEQDRVWRLKFDNGLGETIDQELKPGNFEFRVSPQTGWELIKKTP